MIGEKSRSEMPQTIDEILHDHYTERSGLNNCPKGDWGATEDAECDCGADETNAKIEALWRFAFEDDAQK